MKKYLSLTIISVLTIFAFGGVAYAHNGNMDKNNQNDKNISGFFHLGNKFFNSDRNDSNENKSDRNNNDKNDSDKNDRDNKDESLPRSVIGVAKVTAVSGTTITAVTDFRQNVKTWTISTDANTSFVSRTGATTTISNIGIGSLIGFSGTLTSKTDSSLSVNASHVRIWGDVDLKARVVATGTVTSIDAANTSFTIVGSDGKTITVNSTDLTRIKNASSSPSVFSNISTGMNVKVKGFWNSLRNMITAIKIRII